jgi:predicted O-linked N-acetylglucosamine transferase (SPINDLY family)
VDIAVDLGGHTEGTCLPALALRSCPVQATWLGHPGTTGADFIDYLIADRIVAPLPQQKFYSEKIIHLPESFFPTDTLRPIGVAPSRAEAGLPDDSFVFCCFNNSWKITAPVFDIWMRLLRAVPGSRLWLKDYGERPAEVLRREAMTRGIACERLVFARNAPLEEHLARHALADLFLDTLPYGAHATAADALWAGLPVLTQLGEVFAGRVGASLLTAAGLPELITRTPEDYEATALALARDPGRLRDLREKLAANRATAPLFDTVRFTRGLEAAYETMLKEKC